MGQLKNLSKNLHISPPFAITITSAYLIDGHALVGLLEGVAECVHLRRGRFDLAKRRRANVDQALHVLLVVAHLPNRLEVDLV